MSFIGGCEGGSQTGLFTKISHSHEQKKKIHVTDIVSNENIHINPSHINIKRT